MRQAGGSPRRWRNMRFAVLGAIAFATAALIYVAAPQSAAAAGAVITVDDRLAALKAEVAARGLGDSVRVRQERNEPVAIVEGVLPPGLRDTWTRLVAWYNRRHGHKVFLLNMVRFEAPTRPLPFKAVAVVANKLRLSDGREVGLGAKLPGGWRVTAIDAFGAELRRGADRVRLTL